MQRGSPARAPLCVPQGFIDASSTIGARRQATPTPPLMSEGMRVAAYGPGGPTPYHPQDRASSRTAWRAEHYGEAFGVVTPEAYVPHMVDQ